MGTTGTDGASGAFFARRGRRLAHAMTSPSTIVLTGIVTAGAIAAGVAAPLIGLAAVGTYAAKVAVSTFAGQRRAAPKHPDPDVKGLRSPYRDRVLEGVAAAERYRDTLDRAPEGPVRTRLESTAGELDETLAGLGRAAWRAQALGDHLASPTILRLPQAHREAQARLASSRDPEARAQRQRTVEAIEEQVRVGYRLSEAHERAVSQLEITVARMDQLAVQATEVVFETGDLHAGRSTSADDALDGLVTDLDTIRQAVDELDPEVPPRTAAEREIEQMIERQAAVDSTLEGAHGAVTRRREGPEGVGA